MPTNTVKSPAETETTEPELTAKDRCDAKECNAQAYVRATLKSGDLLFCGHHFKRYKDTITPLAIWIKDETDRIGDQRLDVSA